MGTSSWSQKNMCSYRYRSNFGICNSTQNTIKLATVCFGSYECLCGWYCLVVQNTGFATNYDPLATTPNVANLAVTIHQHTNATLHGMLPMVLTHL